MRLRGAACIVVFIIAYALLIPGLTWLLFSAKANPMGLKLVDIEKSTIGAIHMLFAKGRWVAAATILVCSVIAPFVKAAVLVVCAYLQWGQETTGPGVVAAITWVRRISKWATVDAFTALVMYGFFCTNPVLHVKLHEGFYCFLGYCIFSITGALLLELPEQAEALGEQQPMTSGEGNRKSALPAVVSSAVLVGVLTGLCFIPIFNVQCSMLFLQDKLSFMTLMRRLGGTQGSEVAFLALLSFVVMAPVADFLWIIREKLVGRVNHPAGDWFQDFAMLDVFALAVLVTANATSGINPALKVSLLPGGWLLTSLAAIWVVYCLALRSRPAAQPKLPKDMLTAAPLASKIDYMDSNDQSAFAPNGACPESQKDM